MFSFIQLSKMQQTSKCSETLNCHVRVNKVGIHKYYGVIPGMNSVNSI